jgi:hypothetical protein
MTVRIHVEWWGGKYDGWMPDASLDSVMDFLIHHTFATSYTDPSLGSMRFKVYPV